MKHSKKHSALNAFSLIELSIVLVILGLIIGGVLAGRELIRASELRSVSTSFDKYKTAFASFKQRYFALPGDMKNAFDFWGVELGCTDTVATDAARGGCNGNGDNKIGGGAEYAEKFRAWQHLQAAELVLGNFTGVAGSGSDRDVEIGENIPASKIGGAGYSIHDIGDGYYPGNVRWFESAYGRMIILGAESATGWTEVGILKPEEAWSIDEKIDDGKPGLGSIMTNKGSSSATSGCNDDDDEYDSEYSLTNDDVACNLIYKLGIK